MKPTTEQLHNAQTKGINCTILKPAPGYPVQPSETQNMIIKKMRSGKISIFNTGRRPYYKTVADKTELFETVQPTDPQDKELINYLLA